MATRSLLRGPVERPLNRVRDPQERDRLIQQISERERISEEKAEVIADRLTLFERTIVDIEMREKSRAGHTSDYDPYHAAWKGF